MASQRCSARAVSGAEADAHFMTPRTLTRQLREIARLERLRRLGTDLVPAQELKLRRKPGLLAALAGARRPAVGFGIARPPRALPLFKAMEQDLYQFVRRAQQEMCELLHF